MKIENSIEAAYRELFSFTTNNAEFSDLYAGIENVKLREILSTLHHDFISLFRRMNERLPTNDIEAHFWAEPSRELIKIIDLTLGLYIALKNDTLAFEIDKYYFELINRCRDFLNTSGGSKLPPNMEKIELYYKIPIFIPDSMLTVNNPQTTMSVLLKPIGSGSYADVYKYKDTFYDRFFVVKRAKKGLNAKEIERFKREFDEMKEFSSPYILEVYRYDEEKKQYIMEFMDYTLSSFIQKRNSSLVPTVRKSIVNQILRAFEYIHSRGRLHRDISPNNILLREYHDTHVVKIADFGLVKVPNSSLTSVNTEFKGSFNDPSLVIDGFHTYNIPHETYALTRIIYYVMTGKTNIETITNSELKKYVKKGLDTDKTKRYQTVKEMKREFSSISQSF